MRREWIPTDVVLSSLAPSNLCTGGPYAEIDDADALSQTFVPVVLQ